jgi:CDGSH-type Zn-finger protein
VPLSALGAVKRCPTGALTLVDKADGTEETPASDNSVQVSYNGPLFAKGDLAIEHAPADMPSVKFRAALCCCGASKNKPFCNNSHEDVNFKDFGAVGETGKTLDHTGGPLSVNPVQDGPLVVNGNLILYASSGRAAWTGTKTALCR